MENFGGYEWSGLGHFGDVADQGAAVGESTREVGR